MRAPVVGTFGRLHCHAMKLRPPTSYELFLWVRFRETAIAKGLSDPGPIPQQWPADPKMSERIEKLLLDAITAGTGLTSAQMGEAFGLPG